MTTEDIKEIPLDDRIRAIHLLEIYQKNPKLTEAMKEAREKGQEKTPGRKDKGITLTLEEAQEKWDLFTEKEKESFLRASVDMQDNLIEKRNKDKFDRLPEDIKTLASLSQSDWDSLPQNGQELILRKMDFLEEQVKKIPDVEDFKKLSEEKKEAILRKLS